MSIVLNDLVIIIIMLDMFRDNFGPFKCLQSQATSFPKLFKLKSSK